MRLLIKNVRLAFPALFSPDVYGGKEIGYKATFLLPRDHPQIPEIRAAEKAVYREKWGDRTVGLKPDSGVLRDGSAKAHIAGFEGSLYISASSSRRPGVFNRDRTPLTAGDGVLYSGCYVNALLDVWAQDNEYGKAIRPALSGVQFRADGEPFGGGAPARADDFEAEDWDELEDEDVF